MLSRDRFRFIRDTYKTHGLKNAIYIIYTRLRFAGQSRRILFALSNPRPVQKALDASRNHTFRFANVEDLANLARVEANEIAQIDLDRVEKGIARCLLQLDGEELAGYAWIWTHRLAFICDGFHLNLPDDTIYNYKGYTAPRYRGDGFQALRHLKLLELLEDEGVRRLFGFVDHFNIRSLKGVRKSGYERVGEFRVKHKNGKVKMRLDLDDHFWSKSART